MTAVVTGGSPLSVSAIRGGRPAPSLTAVTSGGATDVEVVPNSRERPPSVSTRVVGAGVGDSGGSGLSEVFVQAASPVQGATPWVWYETDALGDLTGNEYVWSP